MTEINKVAKGNVYETKTNTLIEVTNGRLKEEGELGKSFEGRLLTFDAASGDFQPECETDRFYLDELVRRMYQKNLQEWAEIEQREAEALQAAETETAENKPAKAKKASQQKANADKPESTATAKKMGVLDAALKVLEEAGEPLNCKAMVEVMLEKEYWSTNGATPAATLYSAILRELQNRGDEARFRKVSRGLFEINK